jgi:hypothetical protein
MDRNIVVAKRTPMNGRHAVLRSTLLAIGIAIGGSGSSLLGDVTMTLTGVTGPSMGGVYTSPYTATINGVNTLVICDDFLTDVSIGETWDAAATTISSLTGPGTSTAVKFEHNATAAQQQENYATAAFLAEEILSQDQNTLSGQYHAGILSYALWGLFDPTLLTLYQGASIANCNQNHSYGCLTAQEIADAKTALSNAESGAGSYTQYSNVTAYTSVPQSASQEYLVVSMSEPPSPAIIGIEVLGLGGLFFAFRRRIAESSISQ